VFYCYPCKITVKNSTNKGKARLNTASLKPKKALSADFIGEMHRDKYDLILFNARLGRDKPELVQTPSCR